MSNTVEFYENQFNTASEGIQKGLDLKTLTPQKRKESLDGEGPKRANFVASGLCKPEKSGLTAEMGAATHILSLYINQSWWCSWVHHKVAAQTLLDLVGAFTSIPEECKKLLEKQPAITNLLSLDVKKRLNIDANQHMTPQHKMLFNQQYQQDIESPSMDLQKNLLQHTLSEIISKATLADKSDFASLAFVLVRKLSLKVAPDIMENIVASSNFAPSMLERDKNTRKAKEMANIDRKPALEQHNSSNDIKCAK
jgi:hypothetical protein